MQLVLSTGTGVNGFTLDPSLGEFILTHPDIKVISSHLIVIHIASFSPCHAREVAQATENTY
jgi:fructose-1,6-bisphosphatase